MAVRNLPDTILTSLTSLFCISKAFGIVPHSFKDFYTNRVLITSLIGNVWSVACMITISTTYHIITMKFSFGDSSDSSTLTTAIGIFISYMAPLMMVLDITLGLFNQRKLTVLMERFQKIDDRLKRENIFIKNSVLRNRVHILICITLAGELTLIGLNFFLYQYQNDWETIICLAAGIPILINTLEKIWFVSLVYGLKQRFAAINKYLDSNVKAYLVRKTTEVLSQGGHGRWDLGYLHKEISRQKRTTPQLSDSDLKTSAGPKIITVIPWDNTTPVKIYNEDKNQPKNFNHYKDSRQDDMANNDLNNLIKLETKLNTLCQIHDEICEVGKVLNRMWSLQMLSLMAYGFMSITAQFYFFYCGIADQNIPSLFRSAGSKTISSILIIYTAAKCTYVIYMSWRTKLESRRTGVCLHRISVAVDENSFYEICNHLSLKLLNHSVNFTACGFFNLDMTTLYAVTGAITSYLIILIQFNLAAHRTKQATDNSTKTAPISTDLSTAANSIIASFSTTMEAEQWSTLG